MNDLILLHTPTGKGDSEEVVINISNISYIKSVNSGCHVHFTCSNGSNGSSHTSYITVDESLEDIKRKLRSLFIA